MHRVAVLMSTYNGANFLREQIESILTQKGVELTLFVRDDGSSDETIDIVKEFQKNNSTIKLVAGQNIGVGNSFMQLVYDVPEDFDYYAFADQDDVWLQEKLKIAIEKIQDNVKPALYCSNQTLVDSKLNKMALRYNSDPDITYQQIICQNMIAGCTMLWNRELQSLLSDKRRRPSKDLLRRRIHDVWVALIASVVGSIYYDRDSYILYRQHGANVVGVKRKNKIRQWVEKLKDPTQRNGRSMICREVYEKFNDCIVLENVRSQLKIYGNYITNKIYKGKMLTEKNELIAHTGESLLEFKVKVLLNVI